MSFFPLLFWGVLAVGIGVGISVSPTPVVKNELVTISSAIETVRIIGDETQLRYTGSRSMEFPGRRL